MNSLNPPKPQIENRIHNRVIENRPVTRTIKSNVEQVQFNTEPSNVRLTPIKNPYKYNNTINGIQFNSQ